MNIATKLNAGILAVFAASIIANYAVLRATIQPKFEEIEIAASKTSHNRVIEALDTLQAKLRSSTQDWGYWDDSYAFANGGNSQTFIDSNLSNPAETLGGLGIDLLVVLDSKGSLVWGNAIDPSTHKDIPGLVEELKAIGYTHPFLSGLADTKSVSGMIKTSKGLMLVATAPIIKTDHSGAAAGTIWMGSILDEPALQVLTDVKLRFQETSMGSALIATELISEASPDAIVTSSLIKDIAGRSLAVLQTETPRTVSAAGATAISSATWLSIVAGAIVLFALWLFVKEIVVSRVAALTEHFATAGDDGKIRRTVLYRSNDEIGQLANAFNDMAKQANQLRDVLLSDSAYIGGISEWATGTLHNIRNGLIPINFAAWKAKALFNNASLANVKLALEQLSAPDTSAEKREKLIAYILAKTPQLLQCAEHAKSMSEEVSSASKAVQDMAAGYEKFVRREANSETIDLLPLIQNVAKSALTSRDAGVHISLPQQTAVTVGNRTLLWQIISNILTNAVEAMDRQPHEKRIRIELENASGPDGHLKLSISDNGEGIAPEHLQTIFERGFSTRQHKIGGLGLHWCANAAKELGGSLTVESQGRGTGATLILWLPVPAAKSDDLKEAA